VPIEQVHAPGDNQVVSQLIFQSGTDLPVIIITPSDEDVGLQSLMHKICRNSEAEHSLYLVENIRSGTKEVFVPMLLFSLHPELNELEAEHPIGPIIFINSQNIIILINLPHTNLVVFSPIAIGSIPDVGKLTPEIVSS